MKRIFILSLLLIAFIVSASSKNYKPVNKKASPEAKALLEYLYSLQGKSTLSAQHNYPSPKEYMRSTDSIIAMTGKVPAIWGTDISELDQSLVDEAIRQYKKGCIITLMYHQVKPFDHDSLGFSRSVKKMVTDEQWKQIVTPGTEYHNMWLAKIDARAELLKKLQDANIPVLWRPYHEMNGMWFWYGNRPGKEGIQKLWKIMYDRYTNYHKLNNLIWVWNTNAPRDWKDDEAYAYELFYPGDKYVDILAADIYKNDFKQSHHDQLVKLGKGKLIALGEVGNLPTPEILEQQPQWVWFMCWAHFPWAYNTKEQVKSIYASPRVLTLDEVKR
ncbi:MAG TPA: glycosyl hydrolase [Prolixibacteraceae bacterium]|nr:glycosyl hydrolase [Prolixibacteraceae bacterium]